MPALNGSGHLLDDHADVRNRYSPDEPPTPCWHCHGEIKRGSWANRGLCARCYKRWHDHGFAGDRPPEPRTDGGEYVAAERVGWGQVVADPYVLADFARLDNPAIPGRTAELARRFGVARRTIYRWRARLNEERRRAELLATAAAVCGRTRWRNRLRPGAITGREIGPDVAGTSPVAAMVAAQVFDSSASRPARPAYFRA